jgi:hypothetical protein
VEFAVITLQITGDQAVLARLGAMPGKITAGAKSALDAWATQLAVYIKANKLSGDPLNRRSGKLAGSVHPIKTAEFSTDTNLSAGAGGGAGVKYAKIHEYGGTIHHPGGTAFFIDQAMGGRAVFVSNASAMAASLPRTQPHDIPMPERSYMRSGLQEEAPSGIEQLRAAVKEALVA